MQTIQLSTAIWHPIMTDYTVEDFPEIDGLYEIVLTNGRNLLIGQAEPTNGDPYVQFQVLSPNGLFPAIALGCTHFMLVRSAADEPDRMDYEQIDHLIVALSEGFTGKTDSELLALRASWSDLAAIRRAGQVPDHLPAPYATLPAGVWETCIEKVNEEVERRITGDGPAIRAAQEITLTDESVKTFRDEWPLAPGLGKEMRDE